MFLRLADIAGAAQGGNPRDDRCGTEIMTVQTVRIVRTVRRLMTGEPLKAGILALSTGTTWPVLPPLWGFARAVLTQQVRGWRLEGCRRAWNGY